MKLWPFSEHYEYAAELGLALRMRLPGLWEGWSRKRDLARYPLPQALAFQFLLFLEKEEPETLQALLPDLLREAPERLQQEWEAAQATHKPTTIQEHMPSPPQETLDLYTHPFLSEYNDQSMRIHRWSREVWGPVRVHTPSPASREQLLRVHAGYYLRGISEFANQGGGPLTPETRIEPHTWKTLLLASGAMIEAAELALQKGLALAELAPGSHHAGRTRACGTCVVNHLAVAAENALRRPDVQRIAILDIDAHHGNGSEEIFWDRDDVLTVSIHQEPPFFPGTGARRDIGIGRGRDCNRNIPVDQGWIEGIEQGVSIVKQYRPDLLLVQFGADAHWADTASDLQASWDDFRSAGEAVSDLQIPTAIELGASTNRDSWVGSLRSFLSPF